MWLTKCTEARALNWVSGGVVLNWVLEGSSGTDAVASGLPDIIHEIMFASYSCSHKTHDQLIDMKYSGCVAQWTAGCLLVGPSLCSNLKHLNNYWMDCQWILLKRSHPKRINPKRLALTWPPFVFSCNPAKDTFLFFNLPSRGKCWLHNITDLTAILVSLTPRYSTQIYPDLDDW